MHPPSALYIHIPFCLRKCPYCDFYSVDDGQELTGCYVDAVTAELQHVSAEVGPVELRSIYFGGGTPTLLPPDRLVGLLDTCRACFTVAADAEITCECNPGTVDSRSLPRLRAGGVNRLSLGVQSFSDDELRFLGRVHSAQEGRQAVRDARDAGFDNVSLDLLYCLPDQAPDSWEENLRTALTFEPAHISAYCLQVEPGTPLERRVAAGEVSPMDDDDQADLYARTAGILARGGLAQYEVSNYAVAGKECRHNMAYWRNEPYVGVGASAWSFVGGWRCQNAADVEAYTASWSKDEPSIAYQEACAGTAAANETLMMGLRTREGVSLSVFRVRHGVELEALRATEIRRLCDEGLLTLSGDRLAPLPAGMALVGEITAILALSEEDWAPARRRKRSEER